MIRKPESGYSIIEMMAAAACLAILAVIAIPQIQTSRDAYRLNASARIVASELNRGRALAISRNWTYVANPDNTPPSIQIIDPADANNAPSPIRYLEPGISFTVANLIAFRSRGNSSGGTLTLTNNSSATIDIAVNGAGKVTIGAYTP